MRKIYANSWGGLTNGTFGEDHIIGSASNDVINAGASNDIIEGGKGNDVIQGGLGEDVINGGDGSDTASYADMTITSSGAGVVVSLADNLARGGDAEGDTFISIENLLGSKGRDVLVGNSQANTISGGDGDDIINGGSGDDKLNGGNGIDTLSVTDANTGVFIDLVSGVANGGGYGQKTISGFENVFGSNEDSDYIYGNSVANTLDGLGGHDRLDGRGGNDTLFGHNGNDVLIGGDGHDRLEGGVGNDGLQGGMGRDTFVFNPYETNPDNETDNNVVIDFQSGIDKLEFQSVTLAMLNFAENSDGDVVITLDYSDTQVTLHNVGLEDINTFTDFTFV